MDIQKLASIIKDEILQELEYDTIKKFGWYGNFAFLGIDFILNRIDGLNESLGWIAYPTDEKFEAYCYFWPDDYGCRLFDFSYLEDDKIYIFDGTIPNKIGELIKIITVEEFLKSYGNKMFFSITHYEVKWNNGTGWNNGKPVYSNNHKHKNIINSNE